MKKKLKKAAMAGAALYGASKLMGAREKSLLAATEDNKDASSMITGGKNLNDYNMSNSLKKKTLMEKAKDILKKRVDIPKGILIPKVDKKHLTTCQYQIKIPFTKWVLVALNTVK